MSKAGERIIEGAKEALAIARGEQPAAGLFIAGHHYVPKEELAAERERCVDAALTAIYGHRPDASFDDSMAGAQERRALLSNVADEVAVAIRVQGDRR